MILPQEIIRKKRSGQALTETELSSFFLDFLAGSVADYQMGAMLMAITLKGMDPVETAVLTRIMRDSGLVFSWPYPKAQVVDKHSTGGVGDKTSLPLLPLCILEGLKVPMTAGRGLGHTGGTLDKLETIGWNVFLTPEQVRRQVDELGGVIMGQTEQLSPLDRRLYAMRDVTATVESVPLIVGSILSKKLAEGIGGLVMDVKFGSGAFMAEKTEARRLALELQRVGKECGIQVRCALTSMDSPLGTTAGNALEIHECVEILQGRGPADTRELTIALAVEMVRLADPSRTAPAIRASLERHLANGAAFELFLRLAAAQGADLKLLENPEKLVRARIKTPVVVKNSGASAAQPRYVQRIDVRCLGLAVLELGGGRRLVTDKIDPWVGLVDMKRVGQVVAPGEPVAVVHANDPGLAARAVQIVEEAYVVGPTPGEDVLIAEWL